MEPRFISLRSDRPFAVGLSCRTFVELPTLKSKSYVPNRNVGLLPADYTEWRARFGNMSRAASGATTIIGPVPEPATVVLAVLGLLAFYTVVHDRSRLR